MQTQQFNTKVEVINFAADEADSAVSQDRILRWHNLDLEPPQLTRRQRGIADMDDLVFAVPAVRFTARSGTEKQS